ncbi:unnamed protein product [Psylliodes chrysocephalus]|uniref:Uncharacterized protein n=1 Tax=Psylliodes chrysocephalus TaxID=3402493 RepID=A0A9P0GDB3_9CUCU|nr:unnamed protein product [Psylliodes chrysocephala]
MRGLNFALETGITVIQKYLQKGHGQMEVDSVHSDIERQIRNKKINIPADYVYICKTACHKSSYNVEYLMHNFFKKYDNLQTVKSIRPGKAVVGAPTVNDLKALKYSKDADDIDFGKTETSDHSKRALQIDVTKMETESTETTSNSELEDEAVHSDYEPQPCSSKSNYYTGEHTQVRQPLITETIAKIISFQGQKSVTALIDNKYDVFVRCLKSKISNINHFTDI